MSDRAPTPDRRAIPDRRARIQGPEGGAPPTPVVPGERAERLGRTFDLAPIALAIVTPDERWVEVNQRALDLLGYSREELLALRYHEFTHPDDVAADRAGRARLLAGEIPQHRIEKRYIRKDGSVIWVLVTMSVVRAAEDGPDYLIAAVEDITERKRAETALAASERRFEHVAANVPGVVYQLLKRPDGTVEIPCLSDGARQFFGRAPEVIQRDPSVITDAIHPADRPSWDTTLANSAESLAPWRWEGRVMLPAGEERWVQGAAQPERQPDGSILWNGLLLDVTERRGVAERLEESEQHYRSLFELHPDAVFAVDAEGRFTRINAASETVTGYRPEELVGQHFAPLLAPEDVDRATAHFRAGMAGETQPPHEVALRHKSGRKVQVSVTTSPIVVHGRVVGVFGTARDLTAQHALEAQLRQAQKMEAIGRLAGGIAHDFNNLLMAILANAELLLEESAGRACREEVAIIRETAERAAALTRQLLDFSHRQIVHPRRIDLNKVVRDTGRMLRSSIGDGVTLTLDLEPSPGKVLADPDQLEHAVINLVMNAKDAMPHGGRLALRTRNVVVDEAGAREHPGRRPGMYVAIAVQDTGVGIAPGLQGRIFEPFFTTKPVGRGSGLGLATVYGIVEQWGGWIDVQSEPGKGTTFTIYLPQDEAAPQPEEPRTSKPQAPCIGNILVVDDDPAVRSSVRRMLARQGYTVLEATHGEDAQRVIAESASPIDLVLTDLVMPVMDGPQLIAALRRLPRAPRIVVMSGSDPAAVPRGEPLPADVRFLQKPFTYDELFRSVRKALEATGGSAGEHGPDTFH